MTEPPEGNDEDDFLGELDDDMLLDQLGRGEDESGELGEMLGGWRDDIDAEPVPPIAERVQEIHDLNQQYDKPAERSAPRTPTEGASQPMATTEENMAIVRQQTAKAGEAAAAITHAMDLLRDAATQIGGVSGNLPGPNRAMAACTDAASQLEQLQGMVMGLSNIIDEAAANPQAG
jgi:hypothetical protein